jgi:hypothetical protein
VMHSSFSHYVHGIGGRPYFILFSLLPINSRENKASS